MTATDIKTAHLHRRLTEHMDTETADALVERLPPDWEQLATKSDIERLGTDIERLGTDVERLGTDLERLGTDVERLGDGMATKTDLKELGADLRGEMARDLRVVLFTIVGFSLALVAMLATILVSGG